MSFTGARTATSGAGNNRIITATLPSGVTAGDLLLCKLTVSQGGSTYTQPTISTPAGWTLIPPKLGSNPLINQGTSAGIVSAWYYRWATASNTAPSWTIDPSVLFKYSWVVEAYTGGPGSGAPSIVTETGATGGAAVGTNTTPTATITGSSWYVETWSERSTTNTSYTTPAGTTSRAAVFGAGGAAADMLWVDSNGDATGSVGGDTTTDDGSHSSWQTHAIIILPSAGSASTATSISVSGTGSVSAAATPTTAVNVTVTGTGSVSGGSGPAVPSVHAPTLTYTLQLVDAPHIGTSSAPIGDLTKASGKSLTLATPDGSQLTWTMPAEHDESLLAGGTGIPGLWEMCCDAIFLRDIGKGPEKLWRGRVVTGNDTSDADGAAVTIPWTAIDYKALFASKLILDADTLSFAGTLDVAAIAWTLINTVQSRTNGAMGLTKSTDGWNGGGTANTGKTFGATFVVTAGTDLQSALNTLLAGDTTAPAGAAAGFDWWIDPDLKVHIKSRSQTAPNPPGRGKASSFVADFRGNVRSFGKTALPDQYGNVFRGDGGTGTTPSTASAPTLATDPAGRVERGITVNVNTTQTTAQQNALIAQITAEALYIGSLPASSYTLVLAPGVWDPDELGVGDNMLTVIQVGRLNINGQERVLSLKIDVSDDGAEQITVTIQRPDVSNWQADALAKLGDRVRGLELRT